MRGLVFEKVGYRTCEGKLEMWNRFRSRFYFQENKV